MPTLFGLPSPTEHFGASQAASHRGGQRTREGGNLGIWSPKTPGRLQTEGGGRPDWSLGQLGVQVRPPGNSQLSRRRRQKDISPSKTSASPQTQALKNPTQVARLLVEALILPSVWRAPEQHWLLLAFLNAGVSPACALLGSAGDHTRPQAPRAAAGTLGKNQESPVWKKPRIQPLPQDAESGVLGASGKDFGPWKSEYCVTAVRPQLRRQESQCRTHFRSGEGALLGRGRGEQPGCTQIGNPGCPPQAQARPNQLPALGPAGHLENLTVCRPLSAPGRAPRIPALRAALGEVDRSGVAGERPSQKHRAFSAGQLLTSAECEHSGQHRDCYVTPDSHRKVLLMAAL
ncbi:PREDICTED: uncharacterized protein LOC102024791 isoform X2 [Chinchilla lanigera]|uniref:uncharacterized protein LOC102024791 isoform X2 n=1 Tax=Chinchilla lanigera TaxID=34839 RepID=UPI0006960C8D|nr:PREDICTED: uncharacterized protein LOC102024791 isoform X2 [Chinchilla lanigera]